MPQPLVWNPVKRTGTVEPTARSGHTLIPVGKTYVLYGGFAREKDEKGEKKEQKLLPSNQVYTLKVSANYTCEWKQIQCSGDTPLPRTNHAACSISADKMLIFGGLYTSNQRFNDTYILRITNFTWSQPPNQKSGTEPKNAESKIGAPEPRCNHTITYVKEKNQAFVFGGHGGVSYQRKAFNDLYALNCDTYEWTKLEPEGAPPDPRGGHTAALYENKIFIFGGWTLNNQYSNVMIYDSEKNAWIDPEMQYDLPRWNHCGVMVEAIPSWKYFIFGGSVGSFDEGQPRNLGKFTDDTHVLDMKSLKWHVVNLETNGNQPPLKPKGRDSAQMYYDSNESRLVIFGVWNNNWLGDVLALNVSTITGPPYAIFSVSPKLGPYTGKTKITIAGVGFVQSQNITVTFICGKILKTQQGFYISETEMFCETPNFEDIGPKEAEIGVTMDKGDNTTTFVKFNFFLNTKADRRIAYGPGLLPNNPIGIETVFYIQARNLIGENRKSGADVR